MTNQSSRKPRNADEYLDPLAVAEWFDFQAKRMRRLAAQCPRHRVLVSVNERYWCRGWGTEDPGCGCEPEFYGQRNRVRGGDDAKPE